MGLKIFLFTDLHYGYSIKNKAGKKGINTHGDTYELLKKFRDKITEKRDIVINLGDLVFGNTKEEKEKLFNDILSMFNNKKLFHLIGNHELFLTSKEDIEKIINQKSRLSFLLGGYKHIFLDIEKTKNGFIVGEETIIWLKNELNCNDKIIIYCHYPITEQKGNVSYYHKNNAQKSFLLNSGEIRNIIEGSKCKLFISGHTHFYYKTTINGIRYITIPSFSEDNNGVPNGKYGILDLDTLDLKIDCVNI